MVSGINKKVPLYTITVGINAEVPSGAYSAKNTTPEDNIASSAAEILQSTSNGHLVKPRGKNPATPKAANGIVRVK